MRNATRDRDFLSSLKNSWNTAGKMGNFEFEVFGNQMLLSKTSIDDADIKNVLKSLHSMSFNNLKTLCPDAIQRATTRRVYLDLLEDKRTTDINEVYDAELNLNYLCVNRDSRQIIYIPQLNTIDLDLLKLESVQNKLGNSITLAICDTSSNVLYYHIKPHIAEKENIYLVN